MPEIIPSILTNDPDEARSLLSLCEGKVKRAHIDIIDGVFVDNKTISPQVFEAVDTKIYLDYHLMVKDPINWIDVCSKGQGDRLIAQVELMSSQSVFVHMVQERGMDAGLALNLGTPVSVLDLNVLSEIDVVIVMSVPAGRGGQPFDEEAFVKIEELAEIRTREGLAFNICDDGGITLDMMPLLSGEGVDEVSIGRRLFHGDLTENIDHFRKAAMR